MAAGEGGETSEDEDAEAWALAPPRPACAKRRRAGDPCSDKPLREVRRQQQQAPAALKKRQRAVQPLDTENGEDPAERPRLRLRQTRGPPLLRPVFSLAHSPARVSLGRQHLALALVGGPAGERPELAPGSDGVLRYGAGHEVRVGRAPCSPGPEGNTMQLRGSAKVSRRACSIAWDEASSRFRVASLGSVGLVVDGTHCKAGTHTPIGDGSRIAFFGNPAWPAGHRPTGAFPADTYVFELRSAAPVQSDGSRWELLSPIVSREHCALEYDARSGGWNVTDLGSTFGTAVGGRKLSDGEAAPLRPGSELLLGSPSTDARALGFVLEPDC